MRINNGNAQDGTEDHSKVHTVHQTGAGTILSANGLSPPHEHDGIDATSPDHELAQLRMSKSFGDGDNLRPTLPGQGDQDFGPLQQWLAQERIEHQFDRDTSAEQQIEPETRSEFEQGPLPQYQNFTAREPTNYFHTQHTPGRFQSHADGLEDGLSTNQKDTGKSPQQLPSIAELLSRPPAEFGDSLTSQRHKRGVHARMPSIQQWRTDNLANTHHRNARPLTSTPLVQPSPGSEGILDEKTRRKQELYRQKGEARRQATAVRKRAAPEPEETMRKKSKPNLIVSTLFPNTVTQFSRYPHTPGYSEIAGHQHMHYGETMNWEYQQQQHAFQVYQHHIAPAYDAPSSFIFFPQTPTIHQSDQSITTDYEQYMWPVTLYQVQTANYYDFAQAFLEDLFKNNLPSDVAYKWHTHSTTGFIKGGDRLSFIVLHNATNPFTWGMPPDSTTSIGVYGRYSNLNERVIHWKTVAPSISTILQTCMDQGYIAVKQKWHQDMEKASERRFHRAYWLAANMMPLKGLLGHALPDEKAHDALDEDADDDFEVTKADLQSTWANEETSDEQAAAAWAEILEHNSLNDDDDVPEGGHEHIVTGNWEWDQFGS